MLTEESFWKTERKAMWNFKQVVSYISLKETDKIHSIQQNPETNSNNNLKAESINQGDTSKARHVNDQGNKNFK